MEYISIIICSRKQNINNDLSYNIKNTIGCNYELIIIDNSTNQYSIFEAYNLGIKKSKGELIVFLHDDIIIHTQDWGLVLKNIFKNDAKIGLVGVAGAKVKTKMPSAWWDCAEEQKVINIIQHFPNKEKKKLNLGFDNNCNVEVAVVDGVFMAIRKDNRIKFNVNFKGFHKYDLNLSFETFKYGYKIIVTNNILIEHLSRGTINKSWYLSTIEIHEIYKKYLPILIDFNKTNKNLNSLEFSNGARFVIQLLNFDFVNKAFVIWIKLIFIKPFSKFHLKFLNLLLHKIGSFFFI